MRQHLTVILKWIHPVPACSSDNIILSRVFSTVESDEVSLRAKNDWLIKEVGLSLIEKHGEKQQHLSSQKMRELARLLGELGAADFRPDGHLSDFIKRGKFDFVFSAVKSISKFQFQKGVRELLPPHCLLRLAIHLKSVYLFFGTRP